MSLYNSNRTASFFLVAVQQMMFPQATSHGVSLLSCAIFSCCSPKLKNTPLLQNILTFTPPGFKQSLNVKFPDSRLAVCEKCKKNFKTKDMCRVRNTHTDPPWTTAYVCVTVDESCTDEDGKFIDRPMTLRMVTWRPLVVRKPFHHKTPVCAACKRTNRTRSFCRERHKHRQLPWSTVYVLLSALDQADPATVVAGPSKPIVEDDKKDSPSSQSAEGGKRDSKTEEGKDDSTSEAQSGSAKYEPPANGKQGGGTADTASACSETISSDTNDAGDDINEIAESRTFLAKVNSRGVSIHWLDLADYDDSVPSFSSPGGAGALSPATMTPPQIDPSTAQALCYAQSQYAQEHQNTLKSHQQYFFQIQQRQHEQYAQWQQQYAQQIAQGGCDLTSIMTAGDAATASQQRHQGGNGAVSPTAAAVTASPPALPHHQQQQQLPWPAYFAAPATGFYSPPSTTHTVDQSDQGNQDQLQPTASHDSRPHRHRGENIEDEPDAKRNRVIQ